MNKNDLHGFVSAVCLPTESVPGHNLRCFSRENAIYYEAFCTVYWKVNQLALLFSYVYVVERQRVVNY